MSPGHFADVEELVVTAGDDPVLVFFSVAVALDSLGEEASCAGRERAGVPFVSVVGHFPARQDSFPLGTVCVLQPDRMRGRAQEILEGFGRLCWLGLRCRGITVLERNFRESGGRSVIVAVGDAARACDRFARARVGLVPVRSYIFRLPVEARGRRRGSLVFAERKQLLDELRRGRRLPRTPVHVLLQDPSACGQLCTKLGVT